MEKTLEISYKTKSNSIIINMLTLIATAILYLFYLMLFPLDSSTEISNAMIFLMSWIGIFIGVYILISWYFLTGTFYSLYTIFILFFFLFNFGQPLMWAFGIHLSTEIGSKPIYPGFNIPTNADILNGQIITCLSILFLHLGAVFSNTPKQIKSYKKEYYHSKNSYINTEMLKAIFIASIIIGAFAIPVTLYDTIISLNISLTSGYKDLYYSEFATNKSNIILIVNMFFFPSLVGLLIGSQYNRKVQYFIYSIFIIYLVLNLLSGDRGTWVYKIFILAWLSHVCYRKLEFKKVLKMIVIAFISLYVVEAIVSLRNVGLGSITIEDFFGAFSFENSPLIKTIFEMGGSMGIVMVLLMHGWDIWPFANTYLLGFMGMLTNKLIFLLDVPFSLISTWFSHQYLDISWGAGFSVVGEAVLNFGPSIAPIVMLFIGYWMATMINVKKEERFIQSPMKFFFAATTLHVFIPVTRGYFQLLLKSWFYGVIIYIVFIFIIRKILFKQIKMQKL